MAWAPSVRRPRIGAAVCCGWEDGDLRIGLVSTKDAGRWTFPKGHREAGETLAEAAAREAWEEAGVLGHLDHRRLLTYRYPSRRGADDRVACFLLHVTDLRPAPEAFRELVWCDAAGARRRLAVGRDPFHAQELARGVDAAVQGAAASRERIDGGREARTAQRDGRRRMRRA